MFYLPYNSFVWADLLHNSTLTTIISFPCFVLRQGRFYLSCIYFSYLEISEIWFLESKRPDFSKGRKSNGTITTLLIKKRQYATTLRVNLWIWAWEIILSWWKSMGWYSWSVRTYRDTRRDGEGEEGSSGLDGVDAEAGDGSKLHRPTTFETKSTSQYRSW